MSIYGKMADDPERSREDAGSNHDNGLSIAFLLKTDSSFPCFKSFLCRFKHGMKQNNSRGHGLMSTFFMLHYFTHGYVDNYSRNALSLSGRGNKEREERLKELKSQRTYHEHNRTEMKLNRS